MKPIALDAKCVTLLKVNREAVVTKWAQIEKGIIGSSYQARPLDELIGTCTECFDGYLDVLERGDYARIRRFIEKIARIRVTLGFKLAEVQRAFFLFKTVVWELMKGEEGCNGEKLLEAMEVLDESVNTVIFELSEVYQRRVQEEIERQLMNIDGLNQKLARLSITDGLTGLYNHRFFHESLDREMKKSQRYHTAFTLCLFDLDQFKKVNDQWGHLAGDEVLREFSKILRQQAREVDMCFRYGGEEFSVLLPETSRDGGTALAERVRQQLSQTKFTFGQDGVTVTVSAGVSASDPSESNRNKLLDGVDALLYKAKQSGRNQTCVAP